MYVTDYELFKMKANESIVDMYTRFIDIINKLKALGKKFENAELVRKMLRSLPKSWEAKVTAIQEAKDLNTLPLEELLGSLMTYEMNSKRYEEDESKGKRNMAFATAENNSEKEQSCSDEDIALITRKFKKFLRRKKISSRPEKFKKRFIKKDDQKEEAPNKEIICFECKKSGHIKAECPNLKKAEKYKKKKAFKATWSDSEASGDSSSSEEEQLTANMCFMAHDEVYSSESESDDLLESFDEFMMK